MVEKFKQYTKDQQLIFLMVCNLFLPMVIHIPIMIGLMIYILKNRNLMEDVKHQPGAKFLYLWGFLEILVSLFYKNWFGFGVATGFVIIGAFVAYYIHHTNVDFMKDLMDVMLYLSIIVALIGLVEFWYFSKLKGYSFFEFKVQNSPKRRITGTFFNANYYAMMIEFFIAMCLYRWIQVKEILNKTKYVCIGLLNICMLYLTGCRAGFVPLAIIIPLFFILYGEKKWIFVSCGLMVCAFGLVFIKPDLIPRLSDLSTIDSRIEIWTGGLQAIKMYPFFGNGPQTYGNLYPIYGWHKAPHCHNIYIDLFCSYGIVGASILLGYCFYVIKHIWNNRKNKALFSLMVCFLVIFLVHGLVDCPLIFVSTSMTFLIVLWSGKSVENT